MGQRMRAAWVMVCALGFLGSGWAQEAWWAPSAWQASASDQVRSSIRSDDEGLCLDADFGGVSGFAVMRREWPVQWPEAFDLELKVKGQGAVNDIQFKFVDASGDNVWWVHRPRMKWSPGWHTWRLKRRHVQFAWGPTTDPRLRQTRFMEVVVAAGQEGGRTSVCVASWRLAPREADPAIWPTPQRQQGPEQLTLDWGVPREFNGLELRWPQSPTGTQGVVPRNYDVQLSDDGQQWQTVREVRGATQPVQALFLPERESRWMRLLRRSEGGTASLGWPDVQLRSAMEWPDVNAVIAAQARLLSRGELPRAFLGEQNYWTLVGVDGAGSRSALMSEDGAVELGRLGPSVEPVVRVEGDSGGLVTWADVKLSHHLPEGYVPQPVVRWTHPNLVLDIQAGADGAPERSQALVRYTLRNPSTRQQTYTLAWVVRPWQVNPPQQFLNTPGGVRPITSLAWSEQALWVDGHALLHPTAASRPSAAPGMATRVSALPYDAGLGLQALLDAPPLHTLQDPQAMASAALQQRVTLAPGAHMTWGWWAPLTSGSGIRGNAVVPPVSAAPVSTAALESRLQRAANAWKKRLSRVDLQWPDTPEVPGRWVVHSVRSALAHMLMSREGVWLQPGTRSYARTWIRDGAMMVAGLLRLGEPAAARDFVDAFAPKIFESGKVPCCVDARGADPVVENDSHGQYLFSVAEVWRHTGDRVWLARHWPTVQKVVQYQEALRQSQRTPNHRTPERQHFFGLLPPSISHEGYSDKPAYSYWDDFWALRGYKDAVEMAQALSQPDTATRWARWRDEFEQELRESVAASMRRYGLDHVPGAADRGDFDATSTTMALNPAQIQLPTSVLEATFARYAASAEARAEGRLTWKDYTPYELRTIGALVRLGRADQARHLLKFFFNDQRPHGWNQWAEVVLPQYRTPRFLGDMPHAWVSSDYVRSALELWVWEEERSRSLVIGSGWPQQALKAGVGINGLSTSWGTFGYRLLPTPSGWTLSVQAPRHAQVRLVWPGSGPLPVLPAGRGLAWNGRECTFPGGDLRLTLRRDARTRSAP